MSKLGPHVLGGSSAAESMIDAGCKIVKLVSDFGLAERAASKGAIVIGRSISVYPDQDGRAVTAESMRHINPVDAAILFINLQSEKYRLNPLIKIWEGPNEPVWADAGQGGEEDMDWYAAFEAERLRLLSSLGLRGVIGNFSVGSPNIDQPGVDLWSHFTPAVSAANRFNGILGLHEYSSPWMWWMTGNFQNGVAQDDWSTWPGADGWVTLRYRKVLRFLSSVGFGSIKIAITECGLDRVSPVPQGASSGNWRTNAGWWGQWDGSRDPINYWRESERDAERYYAEQLKWYDRELKRDPQVIGATIFTCGHDNQAWADYDIEGTRVASFLVDYIRNDTDVVVPPPPPSPIKENIVITFDPVSPKANQIITIAVISNIGHTNVDLKVYGAATKSKSLTGSGPWTWTWEVGPLTAGSYQIDFVADPAQTVYDSATLVILPGDGNLFRNYNYQGGYYVLKGPNGEILDNKRIPNGWEHFWMATRDTPSVEGQDESQWWTEPEMEVKGVENVHVSDNDGTAVVHTGKFDANGQEILRHYVLFDKPGQKRWQIFKGSGRVWVEVGGKYTLVPDNYRIEFKVFPDIAGKTAIEGNVLHKYLTMDGELLDVLNGEARVVVGDINGNIVAVSDWKNGNMLPYCQWGIVGVDFTLTAAKDVVIYLELRCRWGVPTVGWFLGDVSLTKASVQPPTPPPPVSEMPVIVVTPIGLIKSGDTVEFAVTGDVPYTNIGLKIDNSDPSGVAGPIPTSVSLTGAGPWTWTFRTAAISGQWYVSFYADPDGKIYRTITMDIESVQPLPADLTEKVAQLSELVLQIDANVDALTSRVDNIDGRVIDLESRANDDWLSIIDLEQRLEASERSIIQKIRDALSGLLGR